MQHVGLSTSRAALQVAKCTLIAWMSVVPLLSLVVTIATATRMAISVVEVLSILVLYSCFFYRSPISLAFVGTIPINMLVLFLLQAWYEHLKRL